MSSRVIVACTLLGLAGPAWALPPTTPVARQVSWWRARHLRISAQVRRGGAEVIFIGDSITSGWEGEGKEIWKRYYGRRRAANLGISGDETGHVLWRLTHGGLPGASRPKVVVLLVGVNNAYRRDHSAARIAAGIGSIVVLLRKRLPRAKVLLLGIFPSGAPRGRIRRKSAAINTRIARLADGKSVHYLDIGAKFLGRNGHISPEVMFDYLHLTAKGYGIWARAMEPTLRRLAGEKD